MKSLPLITILATMLLLTACSSHQQRPEIKIPTPEQRLYTLKHRLNLSDEQLEQITPIIEADIAEKSKIMDSFEPGDRESMQTAKKKMENLEWETLRDLSDHLSDAQMEAYSDLLKEEEDARKAQMKERRRGKSGGKRRGGGF